MITAQELRIGNILNMEVTEGWTMRALKVNEFLAVYKHPEWVNPIPLSEEILLKVGFEIKPFSLGLTLDRFRFIWKTEYKYWYVVDAYSQSYLTKIKFVHELQNFVFALTGQELDVSKLI